MQFRDGIARADAAERDMIVDIDLGITNDEGKESTPGRATLALPYRGGKPVPYPFVPPQA